MTTMRGGAPALVVLGMQRGIIQGCWQAERVIATIIDLVARARLAGIPVIWLDEAQPDDPLGSEGPDPLAGLVREPGEVVVPKRYRDGFEGTGLEDILAMSGTRRLVLCGARSQLSVRATLFGALARGHAVTLVEDAHTTVPQELPGIRVPAEMMIAMVTMLAATPGSPHHDSDTVAAADLDFEALLPTDDLALADEALAAQEDEGDPAGDEMESGE